jgi:hypothetical protein
MHMGEFWTDAAKFGLAILSHWVPLLTGGAIIAGVTLWQWFKGAAHRGVYIAIVAITLVASFFLLWRDQERSISGLKDTVADVKSQLSDSIIISFEWNNGPSYLEPDTLGQLWVRVKAKNHGPKDTLCVAYLDSLQKDGESKSLWKAIDDPLRLAWAGTEPEPADSLARTIPTGEGRTFNLAFIKKGANELSIQNIQFGYQNSVKLTPGTYRFVVQTGRSGCRSDPQEISIRYAGKQEVSFITTQADGR